jgi:hypothetical protein
MISFNYLGNLGRLGNQMFQYAALVGIASKHRYDYCLPPREVVATADPLCLKSDITIFECFNIPDVEKQITDYPTVRHNGHGFDSQLFDTCEDNKNLYGYFQTEKYFSHIEERVRKEFTFIDQIKIPTEEMFYDHFDDTEVISLHIRRGDYVTNPNHPVQSLEYYKKALRMLDQYLPVFVFSDDIEWCKEQKLFDDDRFIFSEDNNTGVDLCLQSLCKYHIIANSSFSWWGAWLAKSKQIIAPKNWFSGKCSENDMNDVSFGNWSYIDA